jgi:hypothetical protein
MRQRTREEVAASRTVGPMTHRGMRVLIFIAIVAVTLTVAFGTVWVTESVAITPLFFLVLAVEGVVVFGLPVWSRLMRERFVARQGARARGRIVRYSRVGSAGAYPASPVLEITFDVTTPEGQNVQAATIDMGHRDERFNEALVGREAWVYWHPRYPALAVPEESGWWL